MSIRCINNNLINIWLLVTIYQVELRKRFKSDNGSTTKRIQSKSDLIQIQLTNNEYLKDQNYVNNFK